MNVFEKEIDYTIESYITLHRFKVLSSNILFLINAKKKTTTKTMKQMIDFFVCF